MFGNPSRPPIGPFRRALPLVQACLQVCLHESGLPPCISAMMLVALQNNSFIDVWCNRKYCLYVKFIFSVFIFPLIISTIQIKRWQSHQSNEILQREFCGIPEKLLWKKNKNCLGFEVRLGNREIFFRDAMSGLPTVCRNIGRNRKTIEKPYRCLSLP